jgi:DNA-binding transcriptional MerR regulator
MDSGLLSISDLADAAGVSARAVRFYVQQALLHAPLGRGRGAHYDQSHLDRLRQILDLQQAGHSLDAIHKILVGEALPTPDRPIRRPRPSVSSSLWTRVQLADGIELHFDTTRHSVPAEGLVALREQARKLFGIDKNSNGEE